MTTTEEQHPAPEENTESSCCCGSGACEDEQMKLDADEQVVEMSPEAAALFEDLQRQVKEAEDARLRSLADYRNFQRRSLENESRARTGAVADVVRALLPVVDQFDLALAQDLDGLTIQQFAEGVGLAQQEMDKVLGSFKVERINPAPGSEFDPNQHEAMTRMPSADIEPDHIASVYQVGFALGDVVLRPAKVVVAAPVENGN